MSRYQIDQMPAETHIPKKSEIFSLMVVPLVGIALGLFVMLSLLLSFPWGGELTPDQVSKLKNLTTLSKGLELYRNDHGQLPARLADLAPEYIWDKPEMCISPATNTPYHYTPDDPEIVIYEDDHTHDPDGTFGRHVVYADDLRVQWQLREGE